MDRLSRRVGEGEEIEEKKNTPEDVGKKHHKKNKRKEQTTENKKTHQTKVRWEENNGMMC